MTLFTVDLDVVRNLCPRAYAVQYRRSAGKGGLHLMWVCPRKVCKQCSRFQQLHDDPKRLEWDRKRPRSRRGVLWDNKGGKPAGKWKQLGLSENQKQNCSTRQPHPLSVRKGEK